MHGELKDQRQRESFLGLDVGGTCIKWGIIDNMGTILRTGLVDTRVDLGRERFLDTLSGLIRNAGSVRGVGICTAGIVDAERGAILGGIENIPFLKDLELRALLEKETGRPVQVINDVNAAVLGEHWAGAGRECGTLLCVTIGTGIGSSLMIDGKVHNGVHFHAGEIGYMRYGPETGCLENRFSARALLDTARQALGNACLTPDELFDRISGKEPAALGVYRAWIWGLGSALADVLLMLDPEKLIIGGGITERGNLLLEPLTEAIQGCLPQEMKGHYVIELAQCGNHAGILGAVRSFMLTRQA